MYHFNDLQNLVQENLDLIEITKNSFSEARERAAKFLVVQAILSNHLKDLEDIKVKASTIEKAQFAQSVLCASGKNITENKMQAEADPVYAATRESLELVDSELNWTKRHYEIFAQGHVLFRQIASDQK
jgi:hypothetical protein